MTLQADQKQKGIPDWVWIIILGIPLVYLLRHFLWWMFCPSYERLSAMEIDTLRTDYKPGTRKVDDLTLIKGIGPKLSQALQDGGIWSFSQLALLSDEDLNQALTRANARISNAETWKTQAELAARQAWKELEEYQQNI